MTQAQFLALAAARFEQLQALNKLNSFYDYEKDFDQIWTGLGRDVLEKNLGELQHRFLWVKQGLAHKFCHIFDPGAQWHKRDG